MLGEMAPRSYLASLGGRRAITTVWLIERYDAFASNACEDGLARSDWSEVLGKLIGTSGYASSGEGDNGTRRSQT